MFFELEMHAVYILQPVLMQTAFLVNVHVGHFLTQKMQQITFARFTTIQLITDTVRHLERKYHTMTGLCC
jgi:hypothetical protein